MSDVCACAGKVDVKVISMETGDGQQFINLLKGDNNQITDQIMRLLTGGQCVCRAHLFIQPADCR